MIFEKEIEIFHQRFFTCVFTAKFYACGYFRLHVNEEIWIWKFICLKNDIHYILGGIFQSSRTVISKWSHESKFFFNKNCVNLTKGWTFSTFIFFESYNRTEHVSVLFLQCPFRFLAVRSQKYEKRHCLWCKHTRATIFLICIRFDSSLSNEATWYVR